MLAVFDIHPTESRKEVIDTGQLPAPGRTVQYAHAAAILLIRGRTRLRRRSRLHFINEAVVLCEQRVTLYLDSGSIDAMQSSATQARVRWLACI